MGVRHHQLRLVDWNRARRNIDIGNSSVAAPAVANVDQSLRGSDDVVRRSMRGPVSTSPYRPAVACALAISGPEHDGSVATVPQSVDLGRLRGFNLCNGVGALLVRRIDS